MTEAFDLMSNSIFDNIINTEDDQDVNLDDIWQSDLSTSYDINSFPLLPTLDDFCIANNIDTAATDTTNKSQEEPYNAVLKHDCMWSGTCVDKSHPSKKKNFRYYTNESDDGDSDVDVETEIVLENNLPTVFQSLSRNIQNNPTCMFQEVVQNATQLNSCAQSAFQKANNNPQQFTQLQQTYHSIPIIYQNPVPPKLPPKMVEIKSEPVIMNMKSVPSINKLIKIEDVKFEPITVEQIPEQPVLMPMIPEQPVQQMFFYKQEQMPHIVSYFPPINYEPINVMPQFYYPCTTDFGNNGNPVCHLNQDNYYKNIKMNVMDRKKPKEKKKKSQDKRKGTKKTKVRDKKCRPSDNIGCGEGSKNISRFSSNTSDETPIEKRSMHNSMERQRRIGLKNLFVELKQVIPTLDDRERVPKVSILREAISYCQKLHDDEKQLDELKKKRNKLMTRYTKLFKTISK